MNKLYSTQKKFYKKGTNLTEKPEKHSHNHNHLLSGKKRNKKYKR